MQANRAPTRSQRMSSIIAALPVIATTFAMHAMVGCRSRQLKMPRPDAYDEVTPQLTGTTLASAVRAIRPERPVEMASGYGGPQLAAGRAASAGICPLVAKPLVRAELARPMQQRLRQEPAQGSTYA